MSLPQSLSPPLEASLTCHAPGEPWEWLSSCEHLCSLGQQPSPPGSRSMLTELTHRGFFVFPQEVGCQTGKGKRAWGWRLQEVEGVIAVSSCEPAPV